MIRAIFKITLVIVLFYSTPVKKFISRTCIQDKVLAAQEPTTPSVELRPRVSKQNGRMSESESNLGYKPEAQDQHKGINHRAD